MRQTPNVFEIQERARGLYHHAKFGGARISPAVGAAKNVEQYFLQMSSQYGELRPGPLAVEIDPVVLGTPAIFNGVRVLTALLHGTPVLGVSQTLRRR